MRPVVVSILATVAVLGVCAPVEAATKKYCFFEMQSMCPGRQPAKGSKIREPADKTPSAKTTNPPIPVAKPNAAIATVPVPKPKPAVPPVSVKSALPEPKPEAKQPAATSVKTETSPVEEQPPATAPEPKLDETAGKTPVPTPDQAPAPEPKPSVAEAPAPTPPASEPAQPTPPTPEPSTAADDGSACRADLTKLGVTFMQPDPAQFTTCQVANPVQLKSLTMKDQVVTFSSSNAIFNCAFAVQFTKWVEDIAVPVIAADDQSPLASLSVGGYECRGRNGDPSAKMSEHATGNAVDLDTVVLANKTRIPISDVANQSGPNYQMLMALRTSACGYFTTVLGPGANPEHAQHYHFDLGIHGKTGNYRICE